MGVPLGKKSLINGRFINKAFTLPNKDLEYHQIAYHPFIINPELRKTFNKDEAYVFNFDSSKFNQMKFVGKLGSLYLEPLEIDIY